MQLKNRIFLSLQFKNTDRNKFNINIDPTRAPKGKKTQKIWESMWETKEKKTKSGKFDQRYY